MKIYSCEKIRNVALVGHGGSGKTTLAEAALFSSGAISRLGRVENGNSTTDYDPDEVKRKISINSALAPLEWDAHKINLIDTPGYADFIGEVISALRVADAAIIVVDAVSGIQVQTEKAWSIAEEQNIPCFFFINRLDKENADFNGVLADLQETFGKSVLPFQLPLGKEADFKGIIDLIEGKAYLYSDNKFSETEIPPESQSEIQSYREKLIEAAAESDDSLLEKYLEGTELTSEEIVKGLKGAVFKRILTPVLCGSAYKNIGTAHLLEEIVQSLPSPSFKGEVKAQDVKTKQETTRKPESGEPLSALAFKTIADPYVGKLNLIRVYSGSLKADSQVFNSNKSKRERVGHLYFMRGKHQEETKEIPAGDLGAIPKLADTGTGETLCDEQKPVVLQSISFPEPLVSLAVEPKTKGDEEKLSTALAKLAEEDPTINFKRDHVTHESVLAGVGDLHLEVVLDKLHRRFGVDAETSTPKIPYQETIKGTAKVQGKYKKQTGGRGQYGDVWLEVEPLSRGQGFEFVDKIFGGAVPKNYIPAVEKGVREAMEGGVFTDYSTVDVKVTLYDGSYHPVDSSEMAFKIAASMAFKKGILQAQPCLLEPIYNLEVTVPGANTGDVMGDLSGKRGKILGMEPSGKKQVIKAQVPLAEISKYATELRSLTGGRGTYSATFSHYEEVPHDIAQKIIATFKKEAES